MRKTRRGTAIRVRDVAAAIEAFAPVALAEPWDEVGLAIGRGEARVRRVMLSLEADEAAVIEAGQRRAQMLVTHHPPTLKRTASIDLDSRFGRTVGAAVKRGVHVYCAHTNLDNAAGGTNDVLARLIGLRDVAPIIRQSVDDRMKLVVFVPRESLEAVRAASRGRVCEGALWGVRVQSCYSDRRLLAVYPQVHNEALQRL